MKWWIKIGCFLTGWNSKILSNCSEASFKTLKKYTASITILIILWGVIGYCFADRYLGFEKWWQCAVVALGFITIIVQIERQIILTVGKPSKWAGGFRVLIALVMAVLGSAILDQIIFKHDIDSKMIEIRAEEINKIAPMRQQHIKVEIDNMQAILDSLSNANQLLFEEISKEGWVLKKVNVGVSTVKTGQYDADGNEIIQKTTETRQYDDPNPKTIFYEANERTIESYRIRQQELIDQNINVVNILEEEYKNKPTGFMEELRAMFKILGEDVIALIFYILLFVFLISLELFVLFGKFGDKPSDYDLIIEHQLKVKTDALGDLVKNK